MLVGEIAVRETFVDECVRYEEAAIILPEKQMTTGIAMKYEPGKVMKTKLEIGSLSNQYQVIPEIPSKHSIETCCSTDNPSKSFPFV